MIQFTHREVYLPLSFVSRCFLSLLADFCTAGKFGASKGFILRVANPSLPLSTVVIQLKEKLANMELTMNEDNEKQSKKTNITV